MYRLLAIGAAIAAVFGAIWWYGQSKHDEGYNARRIEDEAAAEVQREANRSTAREAEEKESVKTVYRDRFIIKTIREIRDAATPLAACPLPADVQRLLGDAATCAKSDRPGSCGPDAAVPSP